MISWAGNSSSYDPGDERRAPFPCADTGWVHTRAGRLATTGIALCCIEFPLGLLLRLGAKLGVSTLGVIGILAKLRGYLMTPRFICHGLAPFAIHQMRVTPNDGLAPSSFGSSMTVQGLFTA